MPAGHARAGDKARRCVSAILSDGRVAELTVASDGATAFLVWDGNGISKAATLQDGGSELVPYSPHNSLIRNRIVLFPSEACDYVSKPVLLDAIAAYIYRYVDVSPAFLDLVAHYVLLTWVYDRFSELPYLRLRGDFGSGKTRFLLVVGSICYKPIFASGASTVSPIFHMLDAFGGTLLIDEADFRFSDEKAQVVKILNNGNARGFPVLRTESKNGHEFSPRAFNVYGPKLVAMRGEFDDPALESRFITERSDRRALRADIPINLPDSQASEALVLRNQLLLYRFHNAGAPVDPSFALAAHLEPRLRQIFGPLAAMIDKAETRTMLSRWASASHAAMANRRAATVEADVLTAIRVLTLATGKQPLALKDIARVFATTFGDDYGHGTSPRWIGEVLRKRLSIGTHKSHGVFVVPIEETRKLKELWVRYGVSEEEARLVAAARRA